MSVGICILGTGRSGNRDDGSPSQLMKTSADCHRWTAPTDWSGSLRGVGLS